ncbi:MAG: hypothetical protein RRY15_04460 [Bacteroidales bacterium]
MSLKVYHGLSQWKPLERSIITVGSFDGVHKAHKSIIALLSQQAENCLGETVLVSFEPHPRMVLERVQGDKYAENFKLLSTLDEKLYLLDKAGLQHIVLLPFDKEFAQMSSTQFIKDILVDTLHVYKIIMGYNHFFGHDRKGNFDLMIEKGVEYGFYAERFPELMVKNEHLSSSQIRRCIQDGNLVEANELLGYEYFVHGYIETGGLRVVDEHKLLPKEGRYLVKAKIDLMHHVSVGEVQDRFIALPDLQLETGSFIKLSFCRSI